MTQFERFYEELAKRGISIVPVVSDSLTVGRELRRNSDGRVFRSRWSAEVATDLRALHGDDALTGFVDVLLQSIDIELAVEAGTPFEEACAKFYGKQDCGNV